MTNNVFDFAAYRDKRKPSQAEPDGPSPFDQVPWLTVSFFEGEGGPMRVSGHFDGPEHMREAARRMEQVICLLLNRAYTADPNPEHLIRTAVHLFHSGRIDVATFNGSGPDGDTSPQDVRWMIGALPYIGMEWMRQSGMDPSEWKP